MAIAAKSGRLRLRMRLVRGIGSQCNARPRASPLFVKQLDIWRGGSRHKPEGFPAGNADNDRPPLPPPGRLWRRSRDRIQLPQALETSAPHDRVGPLTAASARGEVNLWETARSLLRSRLMERQLSRRKKVPSATQPRLDRKKEQIETTLRRLEEFYNRGAASLRVISPDGNCYRKIKQAAEKAGYSDELLRKARVFADEDRGYSPTAFKQLLSACRTGEHALGLSHIIRLLSVPIQNHQREKIQCLAIKGKWSKRDLDAEISARFGNRAKNKVGRRAGSIQTPAAAVYRVGGLCLRWVRLTEAIEAQKTLLTKPVWKEVEKVTAAIRRLQKKLSGNPVE